MAIRKKKAEKNEKAANTKQEVTIDYIKGNFFRVVRADGVWGGITPSGEIHIDVWSQRRPIPRRTVFVIGESGQLDTEIVEKRDIRSDIVREVEVGVVFRLEEAIVFRKWLDDKILTLQALVDGGATEQAKGKGQ